jgi:hypothetical protein
LPLLCILQLAEKNRFKRSIRTLLGPKNPKYVHNPHKRNPEAYFKQVYLGKKIYEGMEFMAKALETSKTRMTNELMERGMRSLWGEALGEKIKDDVEARERQQEMVLVLRKAAKSKGYDISKFI